LLVQGRWCCWTLTKQVNYSRCFQLLLKVSSKYHLHDKFSLILIERKIAILLQKLSCNKLHNRKDKLSNVYILKNLQTSSALSLNGFRAEEVTMRILYEEQDCDVCLDKTEQAVKPPGISDPSIPDVSFLKDEPEQAMVSFYSTMQRLMEDNPVDIARLTELAGKAKTGSLSPQEASELETLKLAATRQGKAVGAGYGFFFRYKPYPMLAEIRAKEKLFQPPFGPIIVVHGDTVREVLTRHHEFTVDPYGREMVKSLTPNNNDGFDTFILSTDDDSKYLEDKALLTAVVNRNDPQLITDLIHQDCMRRVKEAVREVRASDNNYIDVVPAVARFVPVTLGHHYFGVPAAQHKGSFELTDEMLEYYGDKVPGPDGKTPLPTSYKNAAGETINLPDSALKRGDGVIPDELQIYLWIKAAFRNFFNNVKRYFSCTYVLSDGTCFFICNSGSAYFIQ